MAIAFVQSVDSGTIVSTTTAGITTTSGNFLVAVLGSNSGSAGDTVTDSKGNTWTIAISIFSGNNFCKIIYAKNITGGSGHTFTGTSSGAYATLIVHEYSGIDTVSPLDQIASASGLDSGATPTTTLADELVVGGTMNGTDTVSVGSGYSNFVGRFGGGGQAYTGMESKIVSSTGTYNATFGGTANAAAGTAVATFKAPAPASIGNFLGFF